LILVRLHDVLREEDRLNFPFNGGVNTIQEGPDHRLDLGQRHIRRFERYFGWNCKRTSRA
jgi:hypothetical protein